jgi:hypothetical protein
MASFLLRIYGEDGVGVPRLERHIRHVEHYVSVFRCGTKATAKHRREKAGLKRVEDRG